MICQLMRIVIVLIPVIIFGILIRKIDLKMNEFLSYIFFLFIVFIMFILSQVPFEYLFLRFNITHFQIFSNHLCHYQRKRVKILRNKKDNGYS